MRLGRLADVRMNFADESYVRLYVRDTKTWLRLGFAGQCVLMFVLRKLDRAGVLDGIEDLFPDVSLITGVPDHIVETGLPRLLQSGVFEIHGTCLVMPNFIEAQTAIRTDKARQKDARDKRLAESRLEALRDGSVTGRDADVTARDQTSRAPTQPTTAQQPVTLYSAVPSSAVLGCAGQDPPTPIAPDDDPPSVTEVRPAGASKSRRWHPSRFVPDDWAPNDAHRFRCQELRFDIDELVGRFRKQEFNRDYSDWDKRFDLWIEDQKIARETATASARAGPKRSGSAQGNHGRTGFEGIKS
jgi:hypothetical protein